MGQLASLLRDAGHDVSGSDMAFDPPMGPALEAAGIRCLVGYAAEHIDASLELVVIGNAIRKDNAEAVRAEELGLARTSMSAALREHFLTGRRPLVVAGTHGKTTTSAMCAWILDQAGLEPGFFIGGLPKNFTSGAQIGSTRRKLPTASTHARTAHASGVSAKPSPFVVEGDEYDAVYWNKQPKFFDYVGVGRDDVAMITSIEQDHIDIYPTEALYEAQFEAFVAKIPAEGLLVCDARDPRTRKIVRARLQKEGASDGRTVFYAIDGDDTGDVTPTWLAAMVTPEPDSGMQPFDVYAGGSFCGRFALKVPGAHNVRNALGAIAACAEGFGVGVQTSRTALASFEGVRRRQDLLGRPDGIAVYDDFAHHPTAVEETLRALRTRHPTGALWAVFEPRSATACRALHQHEYVAAFSPADRVLFAPLGRTNVPVAERLDLPQLARELGEKATAEPTIEAVLDRLVKDAAPGDTVALLSNGAFGGIHGKLLGALAARAT